MDRNGAENGSSCEPNASDAHTASPRPLPLSPARHISVIELGAREPSRRPASNDAATAAQSQHGRHSVGAPAALAKKTPNDFIFLKLIGEGSFSHVRSVPVSSRSNNSRILYYCSILYSSSRISDSIGIEVV